MAVELAHPPRVPWRITPDGRDAHPMIRIVEGATYPWGLSISVREGLAGPCATVSVRCS